MLFYLLLYATTTTRVFFFRRYYFSITPTQVFETPPTSDQSGSGPKAKRSYRLDLEMGSLEVR